MDNIRITLAEVKEYLRIDSEEEDGLLANLLSASIEHCENFLYPAVLPSESLPMPIKQAVLILVAHFYEQRNGEEIPKVIYVLISPYRGQKW
jgi:uncharacterized phage protein (predicted DNA packaging)